jgi:hypothetical protein
MGQFDPRPGVLHFKRKDNLREGMAALDGRLFYFTFAGTMDQGEYRGQKIWSFDRRHDKKLGELASYWVPDCDINWAVMVDGLERLPHDLGGAHSE